MGAGRPRATKEHIALSGLGQKCPAKYKHIMAMQPIATLTDQTPLAPDKYSDETKEAWDMIVPNLVSLGTITEMDVPSLHMMFDAYEEYVTVKKRITQFEATHSILDQDYIHKRKMLNTWMTTAQDTFNKIAARFGCQPTERSRLPINNPEPEVDPLKTILEGF